MGHRTSVTGAERHVSRRAVIAAGAGLATTAAFGQLASGQHSGHGSQEATPAGATPAPHYNATGDLGVEGQELRQPEIRESVDGVLETTLHASFTETIVNGQPKVTRVFEGMYPAPTLKAKPGDTIRVHFINDLPEMTNLHTHGMHVSPSGNSDNVFLQIQLGETFDFEFNIPDNHPAGMLWYHPHIHGLTGLHVNGGMAGAIILDGGLDEIEGIKGLTDQILIFQSTEFDANGVVLPIDEQSTRNQVRTVNGQINPTIRMRPGETQRWRILNATSGAFMLLGLEGHEFHQIAHDGNPLSQVESTFQLLQGPGERNEVLIQAGAAGTYELRQMLWGETFQSQPDVLLATLVVEGDPVEEQPLPTSLIPFEDLRDAEVDNHREIRFNMLFDEDGVHFVIDGKTVDMDRVDQTVKLGTLEEWTIYNDSDEWHPFHIHINEFQVVAINGEPYEATGWEDTRPLPPHGSITMRSRFIDFTGKYVYHCHILGHEDRGMMGVVEVVE